MSGPQRLLHLLDLANQGPAMRAALAEEVAELLTDWPADCPVQMRGACEALLARAAREVDEDTRARLRVRLYADPQLASRILPREAADRSLVTCARAGANVSSRLAQALGLSPEQAQAILDDASGRDLAVVCKGLGLNRAAFSTLALLAGTAPGATGDHYARLDAFDAVSAADAARTLRVWRGEPVLRHAAE